MTSQWQLEISGDEAQQTQVAYGFPARLAVGIVILATLTLVDATPQMTLHSEPAEPARAERPMPSACGAEAVARAQREVLRLPAQSPTAFT